MRRSIIFPWVLPPDIRERFKTGFFWSTVGGVFNAGLNFALTIVMVRIFGKEVFGEFSIIQNTILTLSGIAQLATGYTANKYIAEFRFTNKEKAGRIIGLCSIVSTVTALSAVFILLIGAPQLAAHWLKASHLSPSLMIAAGMVFFSTMTGYQVGVLAGLERYEQITRASIFTGFLNLVSCGMGAFMFGLNGAIAAMTLASMSQCLIFHYIVSKESTRQGIIISFQGVMQERSVFLKFALPSALSGLISMPALWLANTFLVQQPGGFSEMALYSVASSIRSFALFLPLISNRVTMSLLNNQKGLNDEYRYRKIFYANISVTFLSLLIGTILIWLYGPWFLNIFGREFEDGYPVLSVLLLATIIDGISQSVYQIIQSHQQMWLSFWAVVVPRDMIIVSLAYVLSPTYGALGLAWAVVAGYVVAFGSIILISKHIGLMPQALIGE